MRTGEQSGEFPSGIAPRLEGLRIVFDCANGATYRVAPAVFARAGAEVLTLFDSPDGEHIILGSGATAPAALQKAVVENDADVGFAFDGDGDRVMTVESAVTVLDGDFAPGLAALILPSTASSTPRS